MGIRYDSLKMKEVFKFAIQRETVIQLNIKMAEEFLHCV